MKMMMKTHFSQLKSIHDMSECLCQSVFFCHHQWVEKIVHNWHNYVFQCIFSSGCRTGMLYSYPMLTHLLQVHSWAPTNEINCSPHHFTPPYSFCLKHFFHYLILALDRNRIRDSLSTLISFLIQITGYKVFCTEP